MIMMSEMRIFYSVTHSGIVYYAKFFKWNETNKKVVLTIVEKNGQWYELLHSIKWQLTLI